MKDKIISLKNGDSYYIIDEIDYLGKKYAYGIPCNLKNESLNEETAIIMELKTEQNQIIVDEIYDDEIALEVLKLFQKKFQEKQE